MTTSTAKVARWLAIWLVVQGLAVAFGLWQSYRTDQHLRDLLHAEQAEDVIEDAQRCVAAWEGREDIRDMAEGVYRRNAETLVSLSTDADPDVVDQYRQQVELDVVVIRTELPNPDCDLVEARQALR